MTKKLTESLAAFKEQYHRVKFRAGMARTIMVAITVLLAGCAVDYHLPLSYNQRLLLTLLCYGTTLAFAVFGWLLPSVMPVSANKLAWMIERIHPEFNEKLISSIEFQETADSRVSMDLLESVLEETEIDLEQIKAEQAMPITWKDFALPGFVLALFVIILSLSQTQAPLLVKRIALPSPRDASAGAFRLNFKAPLTDSFAEGQKVLFKVACTDYTVDEVELVLEGPRNRRIPMKRSRKKPVFEATVNDLFGNYDYRAVAGKVSTPLRSLQMVKLPRIHRFVKTYSFPAYTKLKPVTVTARTGNLRALEGARADMTVEVNRPLDSAWAQYNNEHILARIAEDGKSLTFSLTIADDDSYTLHLADKRHEAAVTELTCNVESIPDKKPSIKLLAPEQDLLVKENDQIQLQWKSHDDYEIIEQKAIARLENRHLKEIPLTASATNLLLNLDNLNLFAGDVLEVRIAARDAVEQQGQSRPLRLTVIQGVDLQKSLSYIKAGQQAAELLKQGHADFVKMIDLKDTIRDALVYKSERAEETLKHNRNMLAARRERMSRRIGESASACSRMGEFAFFPKADSYSFLTADYLQKAKLYQAPMLTGNKTESHAWNNTAKLFELSSAMTTGLVTLAENRIPYLSARLLQQIARHACLQDDAQSKIWTRRIHKQALELAREHAPQFTNALHRVNPAKKGKPVNQGLKPGLEGRIYPGIDEYPEDWTDKEPGDNTKSGIYKAFTFVSAQDMDMAPGDKFAARWQGYIRIDKPGTYSFHLESDDGSRLYINGKKVVSNDGSHKLRDRTGTVKLTRGYHDIAIVYYNSIGTAGLYATWNRENETRRELDSSNIFADIGNGEAKLLYLVNKLAASLEEPASRFSGLDKIAEQIREAMQTNPENLEKLATKLETTADKKDWQQVKQIEQALTEASENAESVDMRYDRKIAAQALREAVRARDVGKVRKTAESLEVIDKWQRAQRSAESLRKTLEEAAGQLNEAVKHIRAGTSRTDRQEAARKLENFAAKLEQAEEMAAPENRDGNREASRQLLDQLEQARETSGKAAWETVADGRPSDKEIAGIQHRLNKTRRMSAPGRDLEEQYKYARQRLESMESPLGRKVARARENVSAAAANIKPGADSPDALEKIRHSRDQLTETSADLDEAAMEIRKKAEARLLGNAGTADDARAYMALSAALEKTSRDIEDSKKKMVESVRMPGDPEKTGEGATMRRQSKASLMKTESELEEIEKTLRDWQAAERGELSTQEESALQKSLDKLSKRHLSAEVREKLGALALMKESSDKLKDLSGRTAGLSPSPRKETLEQLKKETGETGRKLAAILASGDKGKAIQTARQFVARAKKDMAGLDKSIAPDNLEARGGYPAARKALDKASRSLAEAETAREILNRSKPGAGNLFNDRVRKPLEEKFREKRKDANIAAARHETQKAAKALEQEQMTAIPGNIDKAKEALAADEFSEDEAVKQMKSHLDAAADALREAERNQYQGQKQAIRAADNASDPKKKKLLFDAARSAAKGDARNALKKARAAGQPGSDIAKSLNEAIKARKEAALQLSKAKTQGRKAAEESASDRKKDNVARARKTLPEVNKLLDDYEKELAGLDPDVPDTGGKPQQTPPSKSAQAKTKNSLAHAYKDLGQMNKALREAESLGEQPRKAASQRHLPLKSDAMKLLNSISDGEVSDSKDKIDRIKNDFPATPASKQPQILRDIADSLPEDKKNQKEELEKLAKEMEDNAENTGWEDNWRQQRDKSLDRVRAAAGQIDRKLTEAGLERNANTRKLARAVKNKATAKELAAARKSAQALNRSFDQAAGSQESADTPRSKSPTPANGKQQPEPDSLAPALAQATRELERAAQYPGRHQKPLAEALSNTEKRQLPAAARIASQTPYAKEAIPEFQKSLQAMDKAWEELGEAISHPVENRKRNDRQWEEIAKHMNAGNLNAAAREAREAGSEGSRLEEALQQAEKTAQNAEEKLKSAAQAAQTNPHKSRAGDLLNQAGEYLAADTAEMPESAAETGQKLSQARDALEKNQFQQAAQAVASAMQTAPGIQPPTPSIQHPASSPQHPASSIQHPAPSPESVPQSQGATRQAPGPEGRQPPAEDSASEPDPTQAALASAAAQTKEAAAELGSPSPENQRAAQAMDSARQQLQQAHQSASQQIASQSGMSNASQPGRQTSPGGNSGGSKADAKHDSAIITEMLGDGWQGTDGQLHSRDLTGHDSEYSPYYRNAMKQYMERVARERAKHRPLLQNKNTTGNN